MILRSVSVLLLAGLLACGASPSDDADGAGSAATSAPATTEDLGDDNDGVGDADEDARDDLDTDRVADAVESQSGNRLLPFRTVTSHISKVLEDRFEVFLLANTATFGEPDALVPFQHIVMAERRGPGDLFTRDASGQITGFSANAKTTKIPTSSGLNFTTFSGIFRIDESDSRLKHYTASSAPMSHSMYIDHYYVGGRNSGVAIHGTPPRNNKFLGKQRASHGCLRVRVEDAKVLKEKLLFSGDYARSDLPRFDPDLRLPPEDVENGTSGTTSGISALIVTFDGY